MRDKSIIVQLYKSLVRPRLEYSVRAQGPHFLNDIDLSEDVQKRANKVISSIKDEAYEDRLIKLFEINNVGKKEVQGRSN